MLIKMDEHEFLDEICFTAIDISREIRFAAVTDYCGVLLAG